MNIFLKYGILSAAEDISLPGWSYGKKITIPASQIDAELTNFPMTVYLNSTNFDFSKCKANGSDIRFTDRNLNFLKFERKEHNKRTYLYNAGDENLALTGGWESGGNYVWAGSYAVTAPVKNSADITLNIPSGTMQTSGVCTKNLIDLSAYSVLKVEYSSSDLPESKQIDVVSAKSSPNTNYASTTITATGNNVIASVDISSVSSGHIVVMLRTGGTTNPGSLKIHKVWIESGNPAPEGDNAVYNILIPQISDLIDTELYMWYGNPNAYNASIEAWQDRTGKRLTYNGNVKLAHNATYGRRMAIFDGSGDWFSLPNNIKDFNFMHQVGTMGKWTAEFKYKANSFTSDAYLFDTIRATPTNHGVYFAVFADRKIYVSISNGASQWVVSLISTAGAFPNDFDLHTIKITYDQSLAANNCKVYIDNALVSQATKTGNAPSTSDCLVPYIGIYNTSYNTTNGCIAGIRFTNGRCRDAEAIPDQFDIDGPDIVFCTNFDTIYDQNYATVQHMGDTLIDATGNGNNGTATGTTVVNTDLGKARSFNGTSDYIDFGSAVKPVNAITATALFEASTINDSTIFCDWHQAGTTDRWAMYLIATGTCMRHWVANAGEVSAVSNISSTLAINTKYATAVKYDGFNAKSFNDGTVFGTTPALTGAMNAGAGFTIRAGKQAEGLGYFSGKLYAARISNIARSDAWIKAESLSLKNQLLTMEAV